MKIDETKTKKTHIVYIVGPLAYIVYVEITTRRTIIILIIPNERSWEISKVSVLSVYVTCPQHIWQTSHDVQPTAALKRSSAVSAAWPLEPSKTSISASASLLVVPRFKKK